MANRRLTDEERATLSALLARVRGELNDISFDDSELLFAYRRKLAKELVYDERSKPAYRKALKRRMRAKQNGLCAISENGEHHLPDTYCVLDRFEASKGYIEENVRLICEVCDRKIQAGRRFQDR